MNPKIKPQFLLTSSGLSALLLILAILLTGTAWASLPTVLGVQSPAWLERGGTRLALRPGEVLSQFDVLETGRDGRVHVALPDGSTLKLGAEARLELNELIVPAQPDGLFRGALKVLRGAFRYTTDTVARYTQRRDIRIQVASITAAIRGTDIWGRSNAEADLLCLIEGRVQVSHARGEERIMDQALTFWSAAKNAAPQAIAPVDPQKLQTWALETEFAARRAVLHADGGWGLRLAAFRSPKPAQALLQELQHAGYPAALASVDVGGEKAYRVSLAGIRSLADAHALARELRGRHGIRQPQVECLGDNLDCRDR